MAILDDEAQLREVWSRLSLILDEAQLREVWSRHGVPIERVSNADFDRRGRYCALCGWTQRQARFLVEGPTGGCVCDLCALTVAEIVTSGG